VTLSGNVIIADISLAELPPAERKIATPRRQPRVAASARKAGEAATRGGYELREAMLRKLQALTSSMPLADLDLLIDIARSVRARSLSDELPNGSQRG
jgi:hypothetical protein